MAGDKGRTRKRKLTASERRGDNKVKVKLCRTRATTARSPKEKTVEVPEATPPRSPTPFPENEPTNQGTIVERETTPQPYISPVSEKEATPPAEKEATPTAATEQSAGPSSPNVDTVEEEEQSSPREPSPDLEKEATPVRKPIPSSEHSTSYFLENVSESTTPVRRPSSSPVPTPGGSFGMPTPVQRGPLSDEDLDERVGSEEEREMEEVLRKGRPTTAGPSGTGGEDEEMPDVTDDEQDEGALDDRWRLKTGIEGGPTNPELLRGFLAHVAYAIWRGEDRGVLRVCKSYEAMLDRWIKDLSLLPDVCEFVENSGLFHLKGIMYGHIDVTLVSAFVEHWHPETNSFHMPWGEVTITLHDVTYLASLP